MAEKENNRTLMDLHRPLVGGYGSKIVRPVVQANTFELKPTIIQMIQMQVRLGGASSENPNAHLEQFLSICDTFKFNGVTADAIRLRLFPFSLQGEAIEWLRDLPEGSITTWDGLVEVFMHKYFPPTKVTQLRNEIISFRQKDGKSLNAAWTRFKKMLRVSANGSFYRKTPTAALEIISNMAESNVGWQDSRRERKVGFLEMDALTAITAKLDGLNHKVSQLQANKSTPVKQVNQVQGSTETVEGSASSILFMPDAFFDGIPVFEGDSMNYVGNQRRQQYNPYSFSYNSGWRSYPNFGWKQAENSVEPQYFNPPQQLAQQRPPQQTVRPPQGAGQSMPPGFNPSENKSNLEYMLANYIVGNEIRWKNHDAMMQRVETQLGQLANQLSSRAPGLLPSDTVKNPKEVNALFVQQAMTVKTEEQEVKVEHTPEQVILSPRKDFLAQMSSYAKFLKDILANKRKLTNLDIVTLNKECSAVLLNKLPPKLQDPGSFPIPCVISSMSFDKALCYLGASINLMSYSLAKILGIGVIEPTTMSLKLADRSIKHPKGIVENVLLKVNEFIFPMDFVVLDMDDDCKTPLILGRPFLATSRALIEVQKGKLALRLNEKKVVFNMFKNDSSYPKVNDSCLNIDARSTCVGGNFEVRNAVKSSSLKTKKLTAISQNPKLSVEEIPGLESKSLPFYLKYLTLEDSSIPVIVSSSLAGREESKLVRLLRDYIHTMGWSIDDIKGLGPIVMVDDSVDRNRGVERHRSTTSNDPP
ncbi:uncharacterized protein [Henckelia pumila]|uniref:uncharacterized protein n=1 Tax=Henckelia pumila TaxID=405737 RepID=UPI003C6DBA7A